MTSSDVRSISPLIASHPDVKMHGAIFNRQDPEGMERHAREGVLIRIGQDPIEFLDRQVFREGQPTGFAIVWNQARDAAWSRVWGHLRKTTRVVLVARNPLRTLLSMRGAYSYIDPAELRALAGKTQDAREDIVHYFAAQNTALIEVSPEETKWVDLLKFLDLRPIHEPPTTTPPRIQDRIQNYSELVNSLRGTAIEEFLR